MNIETLNALIAVLNKNKLTIGFAESVTAGLVCCEFSKGLNVSDTLQGSVVAYTAEVKEKILNVKEETIDQYTAESKEVTEEMATGLKNLYDVDIAVAVTGLANPGGSETEEKPVGTIFLCFLMKEQIFHYRRVFSGSRDEILAQASSYILDSLSKLIPDSK